MEVGRPLEVPMPKFYTAEGRKALVLRKGFSSPTRTTTSDQRHIQEKTEALC